MYWKDSLKHFYLGFLPLLQLRSSGVVRIHFSHHRFVVRQPRFRTLRSVGTRPRLYGLRSIRNLRVTEEENFKRVLISKGVNAKIFESLQSKKVSNFLRNWPFALGMEWTKIWMKEYRLTWMSPEAQYFLMACLQRPKANMRTFSASFGSGLIPLRRLFGNGSNLDSGFTRQLAWKNGIVWEKNWTCKLWENFLVRIKIFFLAEALLS